MFFKETIIFEPKLVLSPESEIIIGSVECNGKFSDNPGHNILALFNNLAQVWITTSKTILDILHNKLDTQVFPRVVERIKTSDLRKLRNIEKMSNMGGEAA